MDDDELIAAMAIGDDTALRELFAQHALAGGHEPVHRPAAAAVRLRLRGRGPRIRQAVQVALLWAALHWHWNTAWRDRRRSGADHRARTAGIGPRVPARQAER